MMGKLSSEVSYAQAFGAGDRRSWFIDNRDRSVPGDPRIATNRSFLALWGDGTSLQKVDENVLKESYTYIIRNFGWWPKQKLHLNFNTTP